jgi:pimeloyl-ACP methyl ester carboxylesterase
MPHAHNRGVAIPYQIEGQGPPLVLQHGFGQSIDDWYGAVMSMP